MERERERENHFLHVVKSLYMYIICLLFQFLVVVTCA